MIKHSHFHKIVAVMAIGMLTFALAGCEKKSPAEKAGKEIDKAVSSAGKDIRAAGKQIEDAVK